MLKSTVFKLSLATALSCLFFFSCQKKIEKISFIQPPIPGLDPSFTSFICNVEDGLVHTFENGTEITIPPNAIVDEHGKLIKGQAIIQYREFQDVEKIYLAGIPMTVDVNGEKKHFQTAGSFEMKAHQNGKSVFLKKDNPACVKMASSENGNNYDFYFLDQNQEKWNKLGTALPEENLERKKLAQQINRNRPSLKFPLNRKYFALNYEIILDVFYNENLKKVNDELVKAKMKKYGLGWGNVEVYNHIDFKGKQVPAALMVWKNRKRKTFPEWTKRKIGKLEKIRGRRYQLTIESTDSTQIFTTELEAVMQLKDLFAFSPEYWINNYQAAMLKIAEEEARMQLMAKTFRSFNVANFGIYNWDKFWKDEESLPVAVEFEYDQEINDKLHQLETIYISGDNRTIIRFPNEATQIINLIPDDGARLFTLLPGNKLATYSAKKFKEINFDVLKKMERPAIVFEMESQDMVMNSEAIFRKALAN